MSNQAAALAGHEPPVMMEAPPARSAGGPGCGDQGKLARTIVKEARHR